MNAATFNFVIDCSDDDLAMYKAITDFSGSDVTRADLEWCLQAYSILSKRNNLNVTVSNRLFSDAVNIVHSAQLLKLKGNGKHFIVCVQADFPHRAWAHYHLVQNKSQLNTTNSLIQFWVQPGLIARDPARKNVTTVAYAGQTYNGNFAAPEEEWQSFLKPHAIGFVTLSKGRWHDLSAVDVLVGIRSFDGNSHNTKPPSKLVNAWHAKVAFIGGADSAYRQVGTPGVDYLMVQSPQEAIEAVLRLRDDEELYKKLVTNGLRKTAQYNNDTIAQSWEMLLTGPVLKRYKRWKERPAYERLRFHSHLYLGLLKHQSKQLLKKLLRKTKGFKTYKINNAKKQLCEELFETPIS